jgi:hypothetical protein
MSILPKSSLLLYIYVAKGIHKEMFSVYGGKCLLSKAVHNWVVKFSQGRSKIADDTRPGAEVAETTVKRLIFCGITNSSSAFPRNYGWTF